MEISNKIVLYSVLALVAIFIISAVIGGTVTGEATNPRRGGPRGGGSTTTVFTTTSTTTSTTSTIRFLQQVTSFDNKWDHSPDIHGTKIIWIESVYNPAIGLNINNIFLCDTSLDGQAGGCLESNTKQQVTNDGLSTGSKISGNRIVWTRNGSLYMCNLTKNGQFGGCLLSDAKTSIISQGKLSIRPDISGNIIVWEGIDNPNNPDSYFQLYICDLSKNGQSGGCLASDIKTKVTAENFRPSFPKIDNNIIIWEDVSSNYPTDYNRYLMMCDINRNGQSGGCLANDIKIPTSNSPYGLESFSINNNKIVFAYPDIQQIGNTSIIARNIYMCDITKNGQAGGCFANDAKTKITTSGSNSGPDINGNTITWQHNDQIDGSGNTDIYTCNIARNGQAGGCLASDAKIQITADNYDQIGPSIYGNVITWTHRKQDGFTFDLIDNVIYLTRI